MLISILATIQHIYISNFILMVINVHCPNETNTILGLVLTIPKSLLDRKLLLNVALMYIIECMPDSESMLNSLNVLLSHTGRSRAYRTYGDTGATRMSWC